MSVPSGRLQFFTLEASDYLERLGLILGRPAPPEPEELVRLTRALRGAALMAGLTPFAQAAQAVEFVAKSLRDGQASWTAERAEVLADAIEELKRLVRQAGEWSDADAAAAERLADSVGGGQARGAGSRPPAARPDDDIKPSVRAFVGREGASIAGTLEHAAQAVELGQPGDTPAVVLQRLQPLRGLASLPSLSPLPEFLDAIELTVRTIREGAAPPNAAPALRRVAQALTRLARDIADTGAATADAPEVLAGARALLASFGNDDDIVDVATLFASGDATPIVARGATPEPGHQPDARIELVSLADRFRQAADQLEIAPGTAARTLSLYALASQLGSLARGARQERPELNRILTTVREAVQNGSAERAPPAFAANLRSTAEQLAKSAEGRNAIIFAEEFDDLVTAFQGLAAPPPDQTIPDERDAIVPISELLAAEPAAERTAFERSLATYHELLEAERREVSPTAEPAPTPTTREPIADFDVVAIESLLYQGRRALERADVVRRNLTVALKSDRPFREVEPLVSELIDLVPLALAE